MDDIDTTAEIQNWRRKVFIIGAIIGALIGLGGAYLYVQRADDPDHLPSMTTGDGVRLGLLVLGLLRSVAELGEG
jgi:hypothetical protein